MRTITCKHCGTVNGYRSRFCESCGKRLSTASQSDSLLVVVVLLIVAAAAAYGYHAGYRLSDIPKFFPQMK